MNSLFKLVALCCIVSIAPKACEAINRKLDKLAR